MVGMLTGVMFAALLVIAVPASGQTLYGADGAQGNPSKLYVLNPANGAIVQTVGSIGFAVTGLAVHPITGVLYGSTSNNSNTAPGSLITINKSTGQGTLIGSFGFPPSNCPPAGQTMADLTFTRDGTLYGWLEACDDDLHTINLSTGAATKVGEFGFETFGSGTAANGCNMILFAGFGDRDVLTLINRRTGQGFAVSTMNGPLDNSIGALAFDPNSTLYGVGLDNTVTPTRSFLYTINTATGAVTNLGRTVDNLGAIAFENPAPILSVVSAVLPASRSVQVNSAATAFVTIINGGFATAKWVCISVDSAIPVVFQFQTTNPATNLPTGPPNTPVDIPPGGSQSFVISLIPTSTIAPVEVNFTYGGMNTSLASTVIGLNTLLLSGSANPVPDIVALAATAGNNGIVQLVNGAGAFAVATANVGATGSITVSADTGTTSLPLAISICQTNPATGQCLSAATPTVTTTINAGATPTFAVFVGSFGIVPFNPASNRVFVRFKEGGTIITRGATSVAARTQ